jgi:predicted metal-dependent hydrolase
MAPPSSRNLPLFTDEEVRERRHVLVEGIEQYNEGYFFEAHEIWEDLWMQCPWPTRRFLQGLIQLAAAFVHFVRHEYPGTVRLLGHAHEKLSDFAPRYMDVDVGSLLARTAAVRDEIVALGPEQFEDLSTERIPQIALLDDQPTGAAKV